MSFESIIAEYQALKQEQARFKALFANMVNDRGLIADCGGQFICVMTNHLRKKQEMSNEDIADYLAQFVPVSRQYILYYVRLTPTE